MQQRYPILKKACEKQKKHRKNNFLFLCQFTSSFSTVRSFVIFVLFIFLPKYRWVYLQHLEKCSQSRHGGQLGHDGQRQWSSLIWWTGCGCPRPRPRGEHQCPSHQLSNVTASTRLHVTAQLLKHSTTSASCKSRHSPLDSKFAKQVILLAFQAHANQISNQTWDFLITK